MCLHINYLVNIKSRIFFLHLFYRFNEQYGTSPDWLSTQVDDTMNVQNAKREPKELTHYGCIF